MKNFLFWYNFKDKYTQRESYMNKIERQNRIKRLIQSGHIGTQEEIKRHLQEEGISVTQATLSRDLREIGL